MYRLICMAFDGDYVTEGSGFPTIEAAWQRADDMGSRWYFYPFCLVTSESGLTIAAAPEILTKFVGRRVTSVQAIFKALAAHPDMQNADPEEFAFCLWHFQPRRTCNGKHSQGR